MTQPFQHLLGRVEQDLKSLVRLHQRLHQIKNRVLDIEARIAATRYQRQHAMTLREFDDASRIHRKTFK
jgi:conjugal transfer/entry exclusion protein